MLQRTMEISREKDRLRQCQIDGRGKGKYLAWKLGLREATVRVYLKYFEREINTIFAACLIPRQVLS